MGKVLWIWRGFGGFFVVSEWRVGAVWAVVLVAFLWRFLQRLVLVCRAGLFFSMSRVATSLSFPKPAASVKVA